MDKYKKIDIENNLHHPEKAKIIDLSHEALSIQDYEWLAGIIKKSSFLEKIILPSVSRKNAEIILSILNQATIKNSTLTTIELNLPVFYEGIPANISLMNKHIQSRMQRNKKRIFAIHGGGSIGLGLMADVVSKSPFKYHIVATSNNILTRSLINSVNKLWLQHGASNESETTCVNDVSMIPREKKDLIQLYTEACLAAICVTPTVMSSIANDIAHALITRYQIDGSGLKILILMNIPNCAKFVLEKISNEILLITGNASYTKKIVSGIEFIPTVIDRIVTPIEEKKIKKQLRSQLIESNIITSRSIQDWNKPLKEKIVDILHTPERLIKVVSDLDLSFNLFNAEKKFSIHVSDNFPEAYRLPAIKITKDLIQLEAVKNKYVNGPHAILAWIGALLGCTTIAESIKHPVIFSFIKGMMENEIAPILSAEYPEISREQLEVMKASFFERCSVSINDPVTRVGRDPLRKLDSGGRIRGTIELAQKHRLNIATPGLEQGLAVGFLYAVKGLDSSTSDCQKITKIYRENNNSFASVLCYSGTSSSGNFTGLNPFKDRRLINSVLNKIIEFNKWCENNQAIESSTALVLSKTKVNNRSMPIKNILFTAGDYFFLRFLAEMQRKHNIDGCSKSVVTSICPIETAYAKKSMVRYYKKFDHGIWHARLSRTNMKNHGQSNSFAEDGKLPLLKY